MKQYWDLTKTQSKVLAYYKEQIDLGNMPSLREAAKVNGVTHTAIAQALSVLDEFLFIIVGRFCYFHHGQSVI